MSKLYQHIQKHQEFIKYFFAGSLAFVVDFTLLVLLTERAGFNYLVANLFGVCGGILVSYLLCVKWVFSERRYDRIGVEFPVFVTTCLVGIGLNEFLLWFFSEFINVYYVYSKIIVSFLIFILNFVLKKKVVFSR